MLRSLPQQMSALVFSILAAGVPSLAPAETVVRAGFASIANDADRGTWTLSSSGATLTLSLDRDRDFELAQLRSPSGKSWIPAPQPDTIVKIGSLSAPFGNRAAGFVYNDVTASAHGSTVQLDAIFDLPGVRARVIRHYTATSGSTAFETWTTYVPLGGTVVVSDLNAFRFTIPSGTLHWINGLQGDAPDQPRADAFTLQQRTLAVGERLSLGATGRSSETTVPWVAIDGESDEFFAALMWSGAWSLTAARSSAGIELSYGLGAMSTTIGSATDGPHAVYGVSRGGLSAASASLRSFVIEGLRGGRPFDPLVTYNTWFAYGVEIDDEVVRAEIDGAAALGAELFVVDAGWYVGAGRDNVSDFSSGLGTWEVDSSRFPDGLGGLTEYAHDRGLKFGIWIEPERVALSTINRRGLAQESWLAKAGGRYGSTQSAQICLASPAAREWILDRIDYLIDDVQPDYVKWDNNLWINCDRGGHGHGTNDGNFAHVNGLYQVLMDLRGRHPDLLIENVSGGGNRLDLGMLRFSDVAWMDDRSAPSVHVRHNVEGLSVVFPPPYLLSFVVGDSDERLQDAADMPLYFRSRMWGTLGLCFRTAEFGDADVTQMTQQIALYKEMRRTLRTAAAALLSLQTAVDHGPPWDVLQTIPPVGNRVVVVAAFQRDAGAREITVVPIGLRPLTMYSIVSADVGRLGTATGAQLMSSGVTLVASPNTAAHILFFTPAGRAE